MGPAGYESDMFTELVGAAVINFHISTNRRMQTLIVHLTTYLQAPCPLCGRVLAKEAEWFKQGYCVVPARCSGTLAHWHTTGCVGRGEWRYGMR